MNKDLQWCRERGLTCEQDIMAATLRELRFGNILRCVTVWFLLAIFTALLFTGK